MNNATEPSLYWFDYETFGTKAQWDRPCQFAGVRTSLDLQETGEPLVIYCQQSMDYLPHPKACQVTGLSPQEVNRLGVPEHEFIRRIVEEIGKPGTCSLGYNSIAFDDEFTRHTLFRNFFDAYEHEYKHGSSRWDLLDVVRLTRALRPDGIEWPVNDDGSASNRLELLSAANGIEHGAAHDALSDVRATIGMARLIRQRQPRLYAHAFQTRTKQEVAKLLNTVERNICLLVSYTIPATRSHLAAVLPLMLHPTNRNGVVVLDLLHDPADLSGDDFGALQARTRTVQINKCPVVVPFNTLRPEDATRLQMDIAAIKQHARNAQHLYQPEAQAAIKEVFTKDWPAPHTDPEGSLYSGGFMSGADRERADRIRCSAPALIASEAAHFEDRRFTELAMRFQARNFPDTLDSAARLRWAEHCRDKLNDDTAPWLSFSEFEAALRNVTWTDEEAPLKAELQSYASSVKARVKALTETDQTPAKQPLSIGSPATAVHEISTADNGTHSVHDKK